MSVILGTMVSRLLEIPPKYSFFLFGPRGVGKTTLLKSQIPEKERFFLDLLDFDTETRLLKRPKEFGEILDALPPTIKWVVIDEVQKLPFLLNEVHRQIESNPGRFFALTGSSARKLRHGGVNLLAGRAFTFKLAPLTSRELGSRFNLDQALQWGTLPRCWLMKNDQDRRLFLQSYTQTYLKEEIQQESLVRQLASFHRFLPVLGQMNGQTLSWNNFAQEVGISVKTVHGYFEILEDTLLGFFLPAFHRSIRKRQKTHPKFYLFDTGIKHALSGELTLPLLSNTEAYGRAFEHFWIIEILRMNEYCRADFRFSYFATHDVEIDLVIERPGKALLFVEIKSSENLKNADLRPLQSVVKSIAGSEGICICREPRKRKAGQVLVCPWQEALSSLGFT